MIGPAIRNANLFPPQGGWGITFTLRDQEWVFGFNTYRQVFDGVKDVLKANDAYTDDEDVWDRLNEIWTARDPRRAIKNWRRATPSKVAIKRQADRSHWEFQPETWGPLAWNWLHSFGCIFNKEHFLMTIDRIGFMLDPARSPHTGCDRCFQEWNRIIALNPPTEVHDEASSARWSWIAHNQVNKKLGKRLFPWASAARRYGWKVDL